MARFHRLAVARVAPAAEDAVAVTLALPDALRAAFAHVPGQHVTVRHGDIRRTYSIASPVGAEALTVGVRHVPGGAFSTHATRALAAGHALDVLPPAGRFTLRPRPGHFAAITGGSGITPVLSMAATLLATEPGARFTLLRSDRSAASAMFLDEVADLKDRHPGRFQALHALTREERHAGLPTGRLDEARLKELLPALLNVADVDGWYLCGPLGLTGAGRAALRALGVRRERVHTELFHVGDAPPVAAGAPAAAGDTGATLTATLEGRRASWPVVPGETLLSAVLRNRPDAPWACRGGVCGTCRARLTDGRVRMDRNYALEEPELAAGYVLACQARPLTDRVDLDFDA
ncbi:2Fe-2S iron-sulfur cluster-binding protein [Streptomyces radicis]|uniref:Phenylacetic acid degradation protein n=1 Tax=Streptomyces radicis TaxID=1750517 RepID=A0A3A9WU78_9ACTN|nr:2Fe-2S iron-sulfur cluster-binding protein [Streptomyces radicis]RKN11346.1 phenylacetic acid degradation protein [Streptomyces radicis]RKN26631.1 phenylacetic acid degradation protein [Streptomyces radicis]